MRLGIDSRPNELSRKSGALRPPECSGDRYCRPEHQGNVVTCGQSFRICAFHLLELGRGGAAVAGEFLVRPRRRSVKALGVLLYHAMRVEHRSDGPDRFAHELQPGQRQFAVRFRVIKRDNLVLEELVEGAGVDLALKVDRAAWGDLRADRPAVVAVVTFAPPAIEHTQIQAAIGGQFHSTRATRFQRPERIVQPKIDALDEATRDVGVVVLDENHPVLKRLFPAELVDLLDERLAAFVLRMRFTGENELHRPGLVVEQTLQAFLIAE